MVTCLRSAVFASVILSLAWSTSANAQLYSRFPLPPNSGAQAMTRGPDGNLWFTEQTANKIGRITPSGMTSLFSIPTAGSLPAGITHGPDGNLWFAESAAPGDNLPGGGTTMAVGAIGRITPHGVVTEFPIPTAGSHTNFVAPGPDGNVWFTEMSGNKIGKITPSGTFSEYAIPTADSRPLGITVGPDGAMWFTESNAAKIGRITTDGATINEYGLPPGTQPQLIANGPDGNLWFTDSTGKIAKAAPSGQVQVFPIATTNSKPAGITTGPDGSLYFVESGGQNAGRIRPSGPPIQEYHVSGSPTGIGLSVPTVGPDGALWFAQPNDNVIGRITTTSNATGVTLVSAILPSSRSVKVGVTASAFATLINSDSTVATSCGLILEGDVPATFTYQTTDPATNAPTGTPNTPVDIPAQTAQTFFFTLTANAPFVPTDIGLGFSCTNENAASTSSGVNTILLSATTTTVPDLVALVASQDPGIIDIPGTTGTGAFAVASVNLGSGDTITVAPDTGSVTLPVNLTICETVPATGACMSPPTPSVTTTVGANQTPTFGVFVQGVGTAIPFAPGTSRIFVRLKDSTSATRGSTSLAVRTQ